MNRVFRSNCLPVVFIVLMFTFADHAIAQQVRDHRSNPTLSQARTVRDHREVPGAAAQVDARRAVDANGQLQEQRAVCQAKSGLDQAALDGDQQLARRKSADRA